MDILLVHRCFAVFYLLQCILLVTLYSTSDSQYSTCYLGRKWIRTTPHHSTWEQLVGMIMMCSWIPVLTALWRWTPMTPLQHPTIHDIGKSHLQIQKRVCVFDWIKNTGNQLITVQRKFLLNILLYLIVCYMKEYIRISSLGTKFEKVWW